jgi:hypothetical protein
MRLILASMLVGFWNGSIEKLRPFAVTIDR